MVAALGGYTPFYPLVAPRVPALAVFPLPREVPRRSRVFACAVLAADGWDRSSPRRRSRRRSHGRTRLAAIRDRGGLPAALRPAGLARALADARDVAAPGPALAVRHAPEGSCGGRRFPRARGAAAGRTRLRRCCSPAAVLIAWRRRDGQRARRGSVLRALGADLLDRQRRAQPDDRAREARAAGLVHPASARDARLYIGGRVRGFMNTADPDATPSWQIPAESTAVEGRMELNAELPMAPSGWRVREALSYDLAVSVAVGIRSDRSNASNTRGAAERDAFLRRSRRPLVRAAVGAAATASSGGARLGDQACSNATRARRRVFSTTTVSLAVHGPDWQRAALFDPDAAGRCAADGGDWCGRGGFLESRNRWRRGSWRMAPTRSRSRPRLPTEGFVVLRDTLRSVVDARGGRRCRAEIGRANGLYRGVGAAGRAPRDTVSLPAARPRRRSNHFRNAPPSCCSPHA